MTSEINRLNFRVVFDFFGRAFFKQTTIVHNRNFVFSVFIFKQNSITFAIGAGLAGLAGVVGGSALSIAPGEDIRYLLASLVVVIIGGLGSITGSAIGAILIGLAEQYGLVYSPTYGVIYTFIIMVVVLAIRPQGIMGKKI